MKNGLNLYLVRHGNTFEAGQVSTQVGARTDLPLTGKGREQALAMGLFLRKNEIVPQAFFAGTLLRQTEAAKIIANELGIGERVKVGVDALNEIDYGAWENLTVEEIKAGWGKEYLDWEEAAVWPHNVFCGSDKDKRESVRSFLEKIVEQYAAGENLVAVTSNGTIRYFYSFTHSNWRERVSGRQLKELKVKTGNFCHLLLTNGSFEVISWNSSPSIS